jgi:hypothetical protein
MQKNHNSHLYQQGHVQSLQFDFQHRPAKSLRGHEELFAAKSRKQSGGLGVVHAFNNDMVVWLS